MKVKTSKKINKSKKKTATSVVAKGPKKRPQWKKVKLSGNLLSDDGGIGLEGLLGLEVLENPSESVRVTREKLVKVKKQPKVVKPARNSDDDDDGDGSDTERPRRSKNERKKQKKLLKKAQEKKAAKVNGSKQNEPGRFVRPLPENDGSGDGDVGDKTKSNGNRDANKKKKGKKAKATKPSDKVNTDEALLAIDDLIVRYFCD